MAKEIKLKTRRLILSPMELGELEDRVNQMEPGELRQAYEEMLEGFRGAPEHWLWYTPWKINLKKDGTLIGDLCFKGPPVKGTVEWGYGLEEPYWGQGYMSEAARLMLDWAFFPAGCLCGGGGDPGGQRRLPAGSHQAGFQAHRHGGRGRPPVPPGKAGGPDGGGVSVPGAVLRHVRGNVPGKHVHRNGAGDGRRLYAGKPGGSEGKELSGSGTFWGKRCPKALNCSQ